MAHTRPPLRPGSVIKTMGHNAEVRRRMEDERSKHRDKLADLAARRQELQVADLAPAVRGARSARITLACTTEADRHRRTIARLMERLR